MLNYESRKQNTKQNKYDVVVEIDGFTDKT